MKQWLLPIVIILVIVIAEAVFLSTKSSTSSSSSNEPKKVGESTQDNSSSNQTQTKSEFKLKDIIEFENRILTVNSIQRNFVESSQYAMTPEEGKEFVLVNVTIENKSKDSISFNVLEFQIENSSGVRTNYGYAGRVPDNLNYGDLAPSGKITGNIPFVVKKGEIGLKLIFKPSFWTNKEVKVALD